MSITSQIKPSHNYTPEYQQSGIPFVKTVELPLIDNKNKIDIGEVDRVLYNDDNAIDFFRIDFDRVTRWFVIQNHRENGGIIRLYFNKEAAKTALEGGDDHYYLIDQGHITKRLELKCKYVYLMPDDKNHSIRVSLHAGLTNILAEDFPDQSFANGFIGIENQPQP